MAGQAFQKLQRDFAAHLRDPQGVAAPEGLEDRRLKIYRELLYNNINGFLSNGFPVLFSLLPEERWHRLVRAFFSGHTSASPYFVDIPREFVLWLETGFKAEPDDPPFMLPLAHYEWMELVLDISQDVVPEDDIEPDGDLLRGAPVLSPLVAVLSYDWPVHQISVDFQPAQPLPEPVWLLVYRDRQDQVGFMEINAATARLLALIGDAPATPGETLLANLAAEMGLADPEPVLRFGADILSQLRERDIVAGARAL